MSSVFDKEKQLIDCATSDGTSTRAIVYATSDGISSPQQVTFMVSPKYFKAHLPKSSTTIEELPDEAADAGGAADALDDAAAATASGASGAYDADASDYDEAPDDATASGAAEADEAPASATLQRLVDILWPLCDKVGSHVKVTIVLKASSRT